MLCLSESFLKESIPDSYFGIQGYEVAREDISGKNGGGFSCYIKSCVSYEKLSGIDDQSLCESVTIKMKSKYQNHSWSHSSADPQIQKLNGMKMSSDMWKDVTNIV